MLQRLRLCRTSDTVFRREIDSRRQWDYGTGYGDSFPAAKECMTSYIIIDTEVNIHFRLVKVLYNKIIISLKMNSS